MSAAKAGLVYRLSLVDTGGAVRPVLEPPHFLVYTFSTNFLNSPV
jgi:hypothetical protein